jgi:TonB family protein
LLTTNESLNHSILIHVGIMTILFSVTLFDEKTITEKFEFTIVEKEVVKINKKPKIVINSAKASPLKKAVKKPVREVFGLNRNALTIESGTVVAKKGNTLTKEEDDKLLKDGDIDSLPAPAEEFLITSMPRAIKEFRPEYPKWAKEEGITGSVIFDILIDKNGKVREARLLKSLHVELDKLATIAIKKIEFRPAYIEQEPVAVRLRYAIRYVLEN